MPIPRMPSPKRLFYIFKEPALRRVLAGFDAAQTNRLNEKHWADVSTTSPNKLMSADTRKILRYRARHEVINNTYAEGIVDTLCQYVVGTGPTLQVNRQYSEAQEIEEAWATWCYERGFRDLLYMLRRAMLVDGEGVAILESANEIDGVTLSVRLIDPGRLTAGIILGADDKNVDGVILDEYGRPIKYSIATKINSLVPEIKEYPADQVIHVFKQIFPEQYRGVPELTPALPLFAILRRYTLATLTAAETAANISVVMTQDMPTLTDSELSAAGLTAPEPNDGNASSESALQQVDFERGSLLIADESFKVYQLKPEQPSTNYDEFKRSVLSEIARVLSMPKNIALCDSSGYNYASGRLDHQAFYRKIKSERQYLRDKVLLPVFRAWWQEYATVYGLEKTPPKVTWIWDGFEHIDPLKEATAQAKRLESGTTTLADELAVEGKDWRDVILQQEREAAYREKARQLAQEEID